MPEIETSLGTLRRKRGLSAIHLATTVGMSRQAIYAIEAGTYIPNTAVALKLARALETTVEELFALDPEGACSSADLRAFEPLDGAAPFAPGEPIQICRVGRRAIGVPAPL